MIYVVSTPPLEHREIHNFYQVFRGVYNLEIIATTRSIVILMIDSWKLSSREQTGRTCEEVVMGGIDPS